MWNSELVRWRFYIDSAPLFLEIALCCQEDTACYSYLQNVHRDITQSLRWRHNDHAGVSNHQPHGCLLNRLFRHRSKKTSKLRVTGLCVGKSPGPVNSPHKGPVTRKMFPFDDVIMILRDADNVILSEVSYDALKIKKKKFSTNHILSR